MRLEQKQSQNIPLTEAEKKELNFVKMEMLIFDVRYQELQEHGTLPNCFRFSLKERLTDEDVDKFIQDYSCCKEAARTICILGAGNLTNKHENMNGVELFHVKAVNKIINKMEKHNFKHLTTVEEGFEKCHELCKMYDLRIQEHYPEDCYYCIRDEEAKGYPRSEGTFKLFAGKVSSLYERMGQRLRDLMYKKTTEFVVENEDNEDTSESGMFPDFDPNKYDSDPSIIQETTERRFFKGFLSNSKSDTENHESPNNSNVKLSFDSKSKQTSVNESENFTPSSVQKKTKKDVRNRSSEFSKNDLNMVDPSVLHRNSNDLYLYKNKSVYKDHRRMFGSGLALSAMSEKNKEGIL